MKTAYCLDCDRSIKLGNQYQIGDSIQCQHCDSMFQLVALEPPELEWLYAQEWEEEEEEEEEEEFDPRTWKLAKQRRMFELEQIQLANRSRGGQSHYEQSHNRQNRNKQNQRENTHNEHRRGKYDYAY